MTWDKDIRFPDKKVDSSWKEGTVQKREATSPASLPAAEPHRAQETSTGSPKQPVHKTSKPFMNLLSSLGYQVLMHLGEIPNPATRQPEINLEAAQEIINLLQDLKDKVEGNTSPEEKEVLLSLVAELQMKFAERV